MCTNDLLLIRGRNRNSCLQNVIFIAVANSCCQSFNIMAGRCRFNHYFSKALKVAAQQNRSINNLPGLSVLVRRRCVRRWQCIGNVRCDAPGYFIVRVALRAHYVCADAHIFWQRTTNGRDGTTSRWECCVRLVILCRSPNKISSIGNVTRVT